MKVTPELVQKRMARFYSLFHTNEHTPAEAKIWPHKVATWSDIFQDTDTAPFIAACEVCERKLKRFPAPADIFEEIAAL